MSSLPCKCSYFHEKVVYTSAPIVPYDTLKMAKNLVKFLCLITFICAYLRICIKGMNEDSVCRGQER